MAFHHLALVASLAAFSHLAGAADVKNGLSKSAPAAAAIKAEKVILPAEAGPEAANLITFDTLSAPSVFASTTALAAVGAVSFQGSSTAPLNGGAVLNESGGFSVTGHSSPNFLAFNCNATMLDGGIPKLPEVINFGSEVSKVSLKIGSGNSSGTSVTLFGIGSGGVEKKTVTLASALATVKFSKPLTHVLINASASACVLVIDDIAYTN